MSEIGEDYKAAFRSAAWLVVAFGIAAMCLLLVVGVAVYLDISRTERQQPPTLPLKGGGE